MLFNNSASKFSKLQIENVKVDNASDVVNQKYSVIENIHLYTDGALLLSFTGLFLSHKLMRRGKRQQHGQPRTLTSCQDSLSQFIFTSHCHNSLSQLIATGCCPNNISQLTVTLSLSLQLNRDSVVITTKSSFNCQDNVGHFVRHLLTLEHIF